MKRTTVMLPDDVDSRLRYEARRRGVSIAELARHAIEQYLPAPSDGTHLSFFALGDGTPPDASDNVDRHVLESIQRHHRIS